MKWVKKESKNHINWSFVNNGRKLAIVGMGKRKDYGWYSAFSSCGITVENFHPTKKDAWKIAQGTMKVFNKNLKKEMKKEKCFCN